jgi:DNA-binding NarL/FixJ family response regulator
MIPGRCVALCQSSLWSDAVPRVLIVGDDLASREVLRTLFKDQGKFEICGDAGSEALALEQARSLSPNLIVVDAAKPLTNGLVRQLRKAAPKTPIFLLTAKYNVAIEKAALASGVTAVFSKLDDLETLIANARAVTQE